MVSKCRLNIQTNISMKSTQQEIATRNLRHRTFNVQTRYAVVHTESLFLRQIDRGPDAIGWGGKVIQSIQ